MLVRERSFQEDNRKPRVLVGGVNDGRDDDKNEVDEDKDVEGELAMTLEERLVAKMMTSMKMTKESWPMSSLLRMT